MNLFGNSNDKYRTLEKLASLNAVSLCFRSYWLSIVLNNFICSIKRLINRVRRTEKKIGQRWDSFPSALINRS